MLLPVNSLLNFVKMRYLKHCDEHRETRHVNVENAYKSMKLVLLTCNVVSRSQYSNVHNNELLPNAQQSYSNHSGICPWSQSLD
jgi:hypothetical protein